jgi:hypothetical protein
LLPLSLLLDLGDDGRRRRITLGLKNNLLKNLEALVMQLRDTFHLDVKSVKVLKKLLHPLDHDLVIGPLLV